MIENLQIGRRSSIAANSGAHRCNDTNHYEDKGRN